jgi:hypothetical protein
VATADVPHRDLAGQTERRISYLTLVVGAAGAILAAFFSPPRYAIGILLGGVLAWLNFRWLRRGMDAVADAASDPTGPRPQQAQIAAALRVALRYALLGLAIYVIFKVFSVPMLSMVIGLFALGVAATAAGLYEILHSSE